MIKKLLKRKVAIIPFIILGAIAYINVGLLVGNWFGYTVYHPNSLAAKILTPIVPLMTKEGPYSPFFSSTPATDPELEKKYGTFENFKEDKLMGRIVFAILWPMVLIAFLVISLITWFAFLFWIAMKFLWTAAGFVLEIIWWLINGGLLEYFHLLP